jgi:ABC-type uncharacterized transport system substrate-binding protein
MKKNRWVIVFMFLGSLAFGHPHMWIDVNFDLHWEGQALSRLDVHWVFDLAFTEQILYDYDYNQDRRLSAEEVKDVKLYAFDNLQNLDYFVVLALNQTTQTMPPAENFQAWIEDDLLNYSFTLDFKKNYEGFLLTIADETNYIAMTVLTMENYGEYLANLKPQEVWVQLGIISAKAYAF